MKKSLKEKFAFWLLKKRFTTSTYVMLDNIGHYHLSMRKNGHKSYSAIDQSTAYEICLAHNIQFNFKNGEEKLVARSVAAV